MTHFNQAIGILGGTFDPIHFGHLRTALELQQTLNLAKVRLIPCFQPVHRLPLIATPEQRLEMVKIAITDEPALGVDDCEIQRQGSSYTVDTLIHLRKNMPNTPLCLIMAMDAFLHFPTWHRPEEILTLAHLVIAHRPQYELPETGIVADLLKKRMKQDTADLQHTLAGNIFLQSVTALEISATDIRQQIAKDGNPRFLLPSKVYSYIKQHGIYHQ